MSKERPPDPGTEGCACGGNGAVHAVWECDDCRNKYRSLLVKYIDHVGTCEGATFLSYTYRNDSDVGFTEAEWTELQSLEREADAALDARLKSTRPGEPVGGTGGQSPTPGSSPVAEQ